MVVLSTIYPIRGERIFSQCSAVLNFYNSNIAVGVPRAALIFEAMAIKEKDHV